MDTLEFFKYVLPSEGFTYIAHPIQRLTKDGVKPPFKHVAAVGYEQAASFAEQFDHRGEDVYFSLATYREEFIPDEHNLDDKGQPRKKRRVRENCLYLKSFWLDLDCGEGKDYDSQEDAVADVERFCDEADIPYPLFVNSGHGIHAYWALTDKVSPSEWIRVAEIFRAVVDHFRVRQDPVCTTDTSRVLRPVGTSNRKRAPQPVQLWYDYDGEYPEPIKYTEFAKSMLRLVREHKIAVARTKSPAPQTGLNSDLMLPQREFPPSSALEAAKTCRQMSDFAASKGNVSEPLWYKMIGLLKHTIEGEELCHKWSSGHPQYSQTATQAKINQWTYGPPSCESFEQVNPAGCEGCPHKGKITSPIQLGAQLEKHDAIKEVDVESGKDFEIPELPDAIARSFSWVEGKGLQSKSSKETGTDVKFISPFFFYPISYHQSADGTQHMTWAVRDRPGRWRTFEVSGATIGAAGKELAKILGQFGLIAYYGQKAQMERYMIEWFNHLRQKADSTKNITQYGWQKDHSFVIGERLYKPDGSVETVKLAGDAANPIYLDAFTIEGELDAQVELIDRAYNYAGQEQYQFMIGAGFGAPLLRLFENYGGLILHGFSPAPGIGKSTAGKLALGIYGNPKVLTRTKQQVTPKAFYAHCGVMQSLPVLLDEATNIEPRELSEMAYTFSQATPRQTLTKTGQMNVNTLSWSTIMLTNANRSLINTIGAAKANASPEMVRIVEVEFKAVSKFTKAEADEILERSELIYGSMGDTYIKYVVQHRDALRETLRETQKLIDSRIGATSADRFMSAGAAATIVGLMTAYNLGLIRFNIPALTDWVVDRLRALRTQVVDNTPDIKSVFGQMLAELSQGVIVTAIEGDARAGGKRALVSTPPRGAVTGRLIQDQGILYLQQAAIRKWCSENQADYGEMIRAVSGAGWADPVTVMYALGKGTGEYGLAPMPCWKINWQKLSDEDGYVDRTANLKVVR